MNLRAYIVALHAALLSILLAVSPAGSGSISLMGAGKANSSGCSDVNATLWGAAVVTAGGTVSGTQATRVCTLIAALKSAGVYSNLNRLWLVAAENRQQSTIDITPNLASWVDIGTGTLTANSGYVAGFGTGNAINTQFIPLSSGAGLFVQNSATVGVCIVNNRTSSQNATQLGELGSGTTILQINAFGSQYVYGANASGGVAGGALSTSQGLWVVSRTASNLETLYLNGASQTTDSFASVAPDPNALYVGANNNGGSVIQSSDDTIGLIVIGAGLSGADMTAFYNATHAYNVGIGAGGC